MTHTIILRNSMATLKEAYKNIGINYLNSYKFSRQLEYLGVELDKNQIKSVFENFRTNIIELNKNKGSSQDSYELLCEDLFKEMNNYELLFKDLRNEITKLEIENTNLRKHV